MPSPETDPDNYNVYATYDPEFLNYAELYKTPDEANKIAKSRLIGEYANALITGKNDTNVYPDSPGIPGNRYFINTGTQCINKNEPQTRSILVDNVLSSAMDTTSDGNTGLMYSLLASMKTINSDTMFTDMSNNTPNSNVKYSPTGYLSENNPGQLPECSKVTVFSNSKNDDEEAVSAWVTSNDRQDIDPKSIKEGMFLPLGGSTASDFAESARKSSVSADATAEAIKNKTNETASTAAASAEDTINKGRKNGASAKATSEAANKKGIEKQTSSAAAAQKKGSDVGKSHGLEIATKSELKDTPKVDTISRLNTLINLNYMCGDSNKKTRVPPNAIQNISSALQTDVFRSQDTNLSKNQDIPKIISVKKIFEAIGELVSSNRYNTDKKLDITRDLPAGSFPSKEITTIVEYPIYYPQYGFSFSPKRFKKYGYKNVTVPSKDYATVQNILNVGGENDMDTIKFVTARTILQFSDTLSYGTDVIKVDVPAPQPKPEKEAETYSTNTDKKKDKKSLEIAQKIADSMKESFETFNNDIDVPTNSMTTASWFYFISVCFILLYIFYKFVDRTLGFEFSLM